ncbi:lytic transglycosylase domain-containing protein [Pseudarthrobacter sulfonivorans]|uniref:lytic transglycosylase domain-containing protein n=1 Tax=Pseudarthrobacter sulfonivorans TaxID=121292 RepID=UPI002857C657|nr:lytic transglycosylase domain-containing protein [Pseudarthrobacter sulfonivorans]MDR6415155.1 membrane-bound lytic murein transglycosylase B [Pseudarthrobacter sulfonivorans]
MTDSRGLALRLKRLFVFCVFAICVITAVSFWALRESSADTRGALPAPPRAEAKLETLSTGITPAVNITRNADAEWLIQAAAQTGIPARALRAYVAAAGAANHSAPGCGIGWNTVAAIGFVESAHGAYGGGSLTPAGQASGPIVGPSLDGNGFAAIADTDAGVLDGDARWDRAVGPMQFIPTTWELAGRDGNGDGKADPFNIDDAALSAADYLCAPGRDLTTANGWTEAIYSYNQSDSYVDQVRRQATSYAGKTGTKG